jgi:serine-type D-Ala-D-Ala carboxypeptidase/endopeptidase (penicillin-binding protein 4)
LDFTLHAIRFKKEVFFLSLVLFLTRFVNAQSTPEQNAALKHLLGSAELRSAQVGVYVYDDSAKKEIASYQSDKYFVPASNTKLFSLYAGMKYLGDSLTGITYIETDTALFINPTGDPSLLHPDFQSQPVIDFLKGTHKKIYFIDGGFKETPWGPGWAWDDYNEDFSAERSSLPLYGNIIRWTEQNAPRRSNAAFEESATVFSSPEISWKVRYSPDSLPRTFLVKRLMDSNVFVIRPGNESEIRQDVPFITNGLRTAIELLPDTLGKPVYISTRYVNSNASANPVAAVVPKAIPSNWVGYGINKIMSRPADSIYMPMMFRSDNFFAEQTLLMVSQQELGYMNDEKIIDMLLTHSLADLPQKPAWVDGSGLSRYNLFSPQDFVSLLTRFKNEFGMDRMKRLLPTGGTGTLKNYYRADSGYLFAKTGSMTGVLCISGYLYTVKKHLLEFSILINNHVGSASAIRRDIEAYLEFLRRTVDR